MIYVVDLEAIDTRYTGQWKTHLPEKLREATGKEVSVIEGGLVPADTSPGAFLNFAGTNSYKSQQLLEIAELFANNLVQDGDYFLYTDAWNPTVLQLKYMAELLGVKIKIGGMWHAGSYDPQDFLGRLIGDANWVRYTERAMMHTFDHNFFATDFHLNMFRHVFGPDINDKAVLTGWPMEYLRETMAPYQGLEKRNLILFPHRIAPEKQPEVFQLIKNTMEETDYEFVVCQDKKLTKHEYHTLLGQSKAVFSANLQETLGISAYEAMLVDSVPILPDRLSYHEMYEAELLYPSSWTESLDSAKQNIMLLTGLVQGVIEQHDEWIQSRAFKGSLEILNGAFFSGQVMYDTIKEESR